MREARVTAMLQHPNTIPTYELGRDASGHYYFTMKLVSGATLREILDESDAEFTYPAHGRSLSNLIRIVEQVCHALHYAHQHGVVHRDMKPENVLIGPFSEVLVLDWGMAKVASEEPSEEADDKIGQTPPDSMKDKLRPLEDIGLTLANPVQGSPPYVSPEQLLRHNTVDHRSDIYSLGAILYEVLAKVRMIPGKTVSEIVDFIRNQEVVPPSSRTESSNVPNALERVCLRCVERAPSDRYQSMDQVINELIRWQESTMRPVDAP